MKSFMKSVSAFILSVLFCTLLHSCCGVAADPALPSAPTLEMTLGGQSGTRAHFEDDGGSTSFVWDTGNQMIAVMSNGGSIVQWEGGEWYSPMNISLIDAANPNKVLRASSSCTLSHGASNVGEPLFFLSPVVGSPLCATSAGVSGVSVDFSMPSTFSQSASLRLDEFEAYCYIHGESTVMRTPSETDKNFAADSTTFRAIPAIIKFNVINHTFDDISLESVKISCSKLFPDKLCWSTDGTTISISEPADKSAYFHTIKTSIADGFGEKIAAYDGLNYSKGSYYALCLPFDDDASMDGATLAFILETSDKVHTFNIASSALFSSSVRKCFESNKIYTFNFAFNDESVELESVSIADWIGDPFYLPTVDVTGEVLANISYWAQDRVNLYTFAFTKMAVDGDCSTMWAKCNIGEYMSTATEYIFRWQVVTPASDTDEDYLAPYFDNITDFKWKTPTRADYYRLFAVPADSVKITHDLDAGVYGLQIHSVDNPGASIFLPCTGLPVVVVDSTSVPDVTTTTRTYNGEYWTLDEADDANAYTMHFVFQQIETATAAETTISPFTRVLNEGLYIYEFRNVPKNSKYPVRAILYHAE